VTARKIARSVPATGAEQTEAAVAAFPVVGIGASAGGLEAFEAFFRACPADTGMAFVLVPHLDPGHASFLTEILQRSTAMPVVEAMDQLAVESNHVYVIPPNREMAILHGVLQLSVPEQARGQRMPIDAFLRSLAEDQAERAIGIILSGTAADGTLGLRAILGAGGVCMVQEPSTAKYDGMPQSAIGAGYPPVTTPMSLDDILNALDDKDRKRVAAALRSSVETQAPCDIEYRIRRPGGTTTLVRSRAMTIADAKGAGDRPGGCRLARRAVAGSRGNESSEIA